jgi:alpha-ribazole phosphatase/probable phosphoglycerate mutase
MLTPSCEAGILTRLPIYNEPLITGETMFTTIDLMRHGEPDGGRKYRGQTDDPLSEKGWAQMWHAVGAYTGWQHIVTSPLSRCQAFADALGQQRGIAVSSEPRFKEITFGAWEGHTAKALTADAPDLLFDFKCDPVANRPTGAEALADFHARVAAGWDALLAAHAGEHLLVVCHAGVIRMLLAQALGMPLENVYRIQVGSAAISRITVEQRNGRSLTTLQFHDGVPG